MNTETFTAQELFDAATSGTDPEYFYNEQNENWVVPKIWYVLDDHVRTYDKDIPADVTETDSYYRAAKDENGFKKVSRIEEVVYDNEYDVELAIEDDDFLYEAGYLPGFGLFKMLDNGNLGDGHEAWAVLEHESGRTFRFEGYYSSWDSSGWEKCDEVVQANVTVVRYALKDNPEKVFDNPAVTV